MLMQKVGCVQKYRGFPNFYQPKNKLMYYGDREALIPLCSKVYNINIW